MPFVDFVQLCQRVIDTDAHRGGGAARGSDALETSLSGFPNGPERPIAMRSSALDFAILGRGGRK
jgi:hypothetical protein